MTNKITNKLKEAVPVERDIVVLVKKTVENIDVEIVNLRNRINGLVMTKKLYNKILNEIKE